MYTLTRMLPLGQLLLEQAPAIGASLIIAEFFYKFHSFTFEAVAFLGTWYCIDAMVSLVSHKRSVASLIK